MCKEMSSLEGYNGAIFLLVNSKAQKQHLLECYNLNTVQQMQSGEYLPQLRLFHQVLGIP